MDISWINGHISNAAKDGDQTTIPTHSDSQQSGPMLIDMKIWYPEGVVRSPVSETGQYSTPSSGRPLPRYVVPPRHWPGINCDRRSEPLNNTVVAPPSTLSPAASTTPDRPTTNSQDSLDWAEDRYGGDKTNPFNQSASIPDSENCSVFITGLPSNLDYRLLFDSIRGVGRIAHCHINHATSGHADSAAKVVFFARSAVNNLLAQVARGVFTVRWQTPKVFLNRIKSAPLSTTTTTTTETTPSRVLWIHGPRQVVDRARLHKLWAGQGLAYELEAASTISESATRRALEYRFASYRAQAVRARIIITDEKRRARESRREDAEAWDQVTVAWGEDPCE